MTTAQKNIRTKVGLLELAKQLGSVSQACQVMGYSRDTCYRFKELYGGGEEALKELSRRKPHLKNRIAPELERRGGTLAIERLAWGQWRVANERVKEGLRISAGGVRGVWFRHDLHTMNSRWPRANGSSGRRSPGANSRATVLPRRRSKRFYRECLCRGTCTRFWRMTIANAPTRAAGAMGRRPGSLCRDAGVGAGEAHRVSDGDCQVPTCTHKVRLKPDTTNPRDEPP